MAIKKPQETQSKRGVASVVRENITIYIGSEYGRIAVQSGQILDVNGNELTEVPDWFWVEYAKVSPEMREKLGVDLKVKK